MVGGQLKRQSDTAGGGVAKLVSQAAEHPKEGRGVRRVGGKHILNSD